MNDDEVRERIGRWEGAVAALEAARAALEACEVHERETRAGVVKAFADSHEMLTFDGVLYRLVSLLGNSHVVRREVRILR